MNFRIAQDSQLRDPLLCVLLGMLVFVFVLAMWVVFVIAPEKAMIDESNMDLIKTLQCHDLRDKIYTQDFERWFAISEDVIFEYEWRCQK